MFIGKWRATDHAPLHRVALSLLDWASSTPAPTPTPTYNPTAARTPTPPSTATSSALSSSSRGDGGGGAGTGNDTVTSGGGVGGGVGGGIGGVGGDAVDPAGRMAEGGNAGGERVVVAGSHSLVRLALGLSLLLVLPPLVFFYF